MTKELIKKIVSNELGIDVASLDLDTDLVSLGMNSIICIKIIVDIESELNIEICDEDLLLNHYTTIDKIFETINKYVLLI